MEIVETFLPMKKKYNQSHLSTYNKMLTKFLNQAPNYIKNLVLQYEKTKIKMMKIKWSENLFKGKFTANI